MTNPQLSPPNNSLALASVILGSICAAGGVLVGFSGGITPFAILVSLVVFGVPGLLAIVFGFIGISTANRLEGRRRRIAIVGTVLGFCLAPGWMAGVILHGTIT